MPERLVLVDGTAIAYRAYFAFVNNPLINSRGENTSAVFGFANTLLKVLRDQSPDYLAIAFDTGAPTFRHQMHAEYKATREKMPDELAAQLPRLRQLAAAFRIPVLEEEGLEADDLIGTLAVKGAAAGLDVVILTGDKDFMQLVGPQIKLINPRRGADDYELVEQAQVEEKFGVGPALVIDLLGLMGDTSDNVPGVPGVGPKTASKLLQEYGSLEAVLASAADFKQKKLRENLLAYAEQARLSRQLVTIRTDCSVDFDPQTMAVADFDRDAIVELFQELEFKRLLEDLDLDSGSAWSAEDVDYTLVESLARVEQVVGELHRAGAFCLDLETTSLDPHRAQIVGIALCAEEGRAYYLPTGHEQGPNLDLEQVLGLLGPLLKDASLAVCGQNLKYDSAVLAAHGIDMACIAFDAMLADYLLAPGERPHNLEALARHHLDYAMQPIEELIGPKGKEQRSFASVERERACFYACEDADVAFRLARILRPHLREAGMEELFDEVEMPLVGVLRDMELCGVTVDAGFLKVLSVELEKNMEELQARIQEGAGEPFNLNSTQQVARILFDKIGLKPRRKTKTGYSTDVNVLEELAQEHPLPGHLLEYRELAKLKSTYIDALPALVHPDTGRIHASFNQAVTATGRLSSSDPNLQNIPIRTPLGRQIRKAFVPGRPDGLLLSADYSQIELRLLAHFCGDQTLAEAFREGEDIHRRTASLLFQLMPEFITPEMRNQAKTVNFGVIYGQTPFGLARQLGIPVGRAREFIGNYFAVYSKVKEFIDRTIEQARKDGYVRTLMGRRRYLPDINSTNTPRREFAERTAVNSPIQGSQADMIKLAMIRIHRRLKKEQLDAAMVLQVHDELVFEVGERDADRVEEMVREEMVGALELEVPVVVEAGRGKNWFEAH